MYFKRTLHGLEEPGLLEACAVRGVLNGYLNKFNINFKVNVLQKNLTWA